MKFFEDSNRTGCDCRNTRVHHSITWLHIHVATQVGHQYVPEAILGQVDIVRPWDPNFFTAENIQNSSLHQKRCPAYFTC